jgi:hypothetical protein
VTLPSFSFQERRQADLAKASFEMKLCRETFLKEAIVMESKK